MKKQVYSSPKTRLVTMSEKSFIMATSGGTVTNVGGNSGIGYGGGGTGGAHIRRGFLDIN